MGRGERAPLEGGVLRGRDGLPASRLRENLGRGTARRHVGHRGGDL